MICVRSNTRRIKRRTGRSGLDNISQNELRVVRSACRWRRRWLRRTFRIGRTRTRTLDLQPRSKGIKGVKARWHLILQLYTFDALIDQFLPGEYDPPAFALKLAHKDVSLANALGRELGMPMRLCNLTLAEMTEALARGWGGRDSRVVMLLQQERAGVEIAVDRERLREALAPTEVHSSR
jgi:NAD-binding of NADP-dependent 3-hydroxyisobutyrate dehydrogenase